MGNRCWLNRVAAQFRRRHPAFAIVTACKISGSSRVRTALIIREGRDRRSLRVTLKIRLIDRSSWLVRLLSSSRQTHRASSLFIPYDLRVLLISLPVEEHEASRTADDRRPMVTICFTKKPLLLVRPEFSLTMLMSIFQRLPMLVFIRARLQTGSPYHRTWVRRYLSLESIVSMAKPELSNTE